MQVTQAATILSQAGDSRLKNLENIYTKRPYTRNVKVQGAGRLTHSSGFQLDNESEEQQRIKKDVDRMQSVLDKEHVISGKIQQAKKVG